MKIQAAVLFVAFANASVFCQVAKEPIKLSLHIKPGVVGLFDVLNIELSVKNTGDSVEKILPVYAEVSPPNFLLYGEGFLEYKQKPNDAWNKYGPIPYLGKESSIYDTELHYVKIYPKQEMYSGIFQLLPGCAYSNDYKKVDSYSISEPGRYFFRAGYTLLGKNRSREIIYSDSLQVVLHDYRKNRRDHEAYQYLKTVPIPHFIAHRQVSILSSLALNYEPYANAIATKYAKSKFAGWAYLLLAEAEQLRLTAEQGIRNEESHLASLRKIKDYITIAKSYRNPAINDKIRNGSYGVYLFILKNMFENDEEAMQSSPLYKELYIDVFSSDK